MMIFFLSALALLLIAFLSATLIKSFSGNSFGIFERLKFKKVSRKLDKFKEFKACNSPERQSLILREILCLEAVANDADLVEQIHSHHQKISKELLVWLGEKREYRPLVEVLDDLLVTRTALLRGLCDAARSTRNVRQKKKSPDWAIEEYRKKELEFEEKLLVNKQSIFSQADRLVKTVTNQNGSPDSDIMVH